MHEIVLKMDNITKAYPLLSSEDRETIVQVIEILDVLLNSVDELHSMSATDTIQEATKHFASQKWG